MLEEEAVRPIEERKYIMTMIFRTIIETVQITT